MLTLHVDEHDDYTKPPTYCPDDSEKPPHYGPVEPYPEEPETHPTAPAETHPAAPTYPVETHPAAPTYPAETHPAAAPPASTVTALPVPQQNATRTHTPVQYTGAASINGVATGLTAMFAGVVALLL